MRVLHGFEIALGALAIITGEGIFFLLQSAGAVPPNSLWAYLLGYGALALPLIIGVILDVSARNNRAVKVAALILLTIGTLLLGGFFAISFIIEFILPVVFALLATTMAYVGLAEPRPQAPRAA